jgi:glycerophosphoryl diester phosphodiesterase
VFFDRIPASRAIGAHRGVRSLAPENTLPAFETAFASAAHFLEVDARLTKDGQVVVFHDDTPARTTDVARAPQAAPATEHVDAFTLAELQSLDAGSWFAAADPLGTVAGGEVAPQDAASFAGVRVPTLEEVLLLCRERDFPVNVEIKDHAGRPGHHAVTAAVLDVVARTGTRELTLLSSFNHLYLTQAAALDPDIPRAALVEDRHPAGLLDYLLFLDVAAYHPDHAVTTPELVRELLDDGLRVNLWTINDPAVAAAYPAEAGIITDFPQRLA